MHSYASDMVFVIALSGSGHDFKTQTDHHFHAVTPMTSDRQWPAYKNVAPAGGSWEKTVRQEL